MYINATKTMYSVWIFCTCAQAWRHTQKYLQKHALLAIIIIIFCPSPVQCPSDVFGALACQEKIFTVK